MQEIDIYIIEDFFRLLLLIGFPMVIGVALSGLLASFIQSCIGISEISISYTFRVIALILILYILTNNFIIEFIEFTKSCFT